MYLSIQRATSLKLPACLLPATSNNLPATSRQRVNEQPFQQSRDGVGIMVMQGQDEIYCIELCVCTKPNDVQSLHMTAWMT